MKKGQKVKKGDVLVEEYLEDEEEALKGDMRQIESLQLQISQAKQYEQPEKTRTADKDIDKFPFQKEPARSQHLAPNNSGQFGTHS